MSVYSDASYENAIMELFAGTLGYERVYGPARRVANWR